MRMAKVIRVKEVTNENAIPNAPNGAEMSGDRHRHPNIRTGMYASEPAVGSDAIPGQNYARLRPRAGPGVERRTAFRPRRTCTEPGSMSGHRLLRATDSRPAP